LQFKDYYQTLGVARDATADDIRRRSASSRASTTRT